MTRGFPEGLYVEGNKYLCELNLEENRLNNEKIQGQTTLKKPMQPSLSMYLRSEKLSCRNDFENCDIETILPFPKLSNY